MRSTKRPRYCLHSDNNHYIGVNSFSNCIELNGRLQLFSTEIEPISETIRIFLCAFAELKLGRRQLFGNCWSLSHG